MFRNEKENDFHEPCKVRNNNTPAEPKSKQLPKGISSAIAAEIRQRDVRNSTRAANTIVAYHAALRKPNTDGTYNVNGKVMSMLDIKR